MDMQLCSSSQQTHGADESRQSQGMVAVGVRDKYVADAFHTKSPAGKACLCAFSAVYHEVLASQTDYLTGRLMPLHRVGTSAT